MNQFRTFAAAVAAAGLLAAMPAAAVVTTATYSGIVASGYDMSGVFGAPGSDLTGYGWVTKYTFDKMLGGTLSPSSNGEVSSGGVVLGNGSPIITSSVTINGLTLTITGAAFGSVETYTEPFVQHYSLEQFESSSLSISLFTHNYAYPVGAPASLDQNFGPVASTGGGRMQFNMFDLVRGVVLVDTWADFGTGTLGAEPTADLATDTVYSVRSAVPEPASWALMIAGFGMVGGAVRRRRAVAAA